MKNFLDKKWFRNTIEQGIFPGVFQFLALIVLIFIMIYTWYYHDIKGVSIPDPLIYTNLGNLLFWIYWMMGIVILVLIWGRMWCAICPLGLINGVSSKFGLKLNYPKSLRNWYLLVIIFLTLQITISITGLNHFPDSTSRLILVFILAGIITGLVFRDRIFCRYLCPVGSMIGIYSCLSPVELRVKDKKTCTDCQSKECIKGRLNSYNLFLGDKKYSFKISPEPCPAQIFPPLLEQNTHCFLCGQCVKTCPNNNIRWNFRNPFKEISEPFQRPFYETLFIIILLGMILDKFLPLWPALSKTLLFGENKNLLSYLWIFLILPGIIILLPSMLVYLMSHIKITKADTTLSAVNCQPLTNFEPVSWSKIISYSVNIFVPLIFFAHLSLAIVKISSRGGFLLYGLADPIGIKSYRAIYLANLVPAPRNLIAIALLKWFTVFILVIGLSISLLSTLKIYKSTSFNKNAIAFIIINSIVVIILALALILVVKFWLFA